MLCFWSGWSDCDRVWLLDYIRSEYSMQLKTWTTIKKSTAILYHVDIFRRYFFVCKLKMVFYFLHELKQRSRNVTRWHLRSKVFQKTSDIQDAYPNLARKNWDAFYNFQNWNCKYLNTRSQQQHMPLNMNHERIYFVRDLNILIRPN